MPCSRSLFNSYAKLTQSSHCCRCKPLVLLRFYKVFDAKWCISLGCDRFGMRNVIFPQVLIGLGCLLEASRASEVLLFIIKSMLWEAFRSSQRPEGHQSSQTITFHYQIDALWTILEQKHQSFRTITFHYQIDGQGAISKLRAPRSTRASKPLLFIVNSMLCEPFRSMMPELPNQYFSLSRWRIPLKR